MVPPNSVRISRGADGSGAREVGGGAWAFGDRRAWAAAGAAGDATSTSARVSVSAVAVRRDVCVIVAADGTGDDRVLPNIVPAVGIVLWGRGCKGSTALRGGAAPDAVAADDGGIGWQQPPDAPS